MQSIIGLISLDPRYHEACQSCLNCGVCTAICPAAEYYPYDPRMVVNMVMDGNEEALRDLLSSDTIWYCGQCMSCKPRCPRGNVPGSLIQVLRNVSIRTGLFAKSEFGRQQTGVKRGVGHNILETGYCIHPYRVPAATHPEQGPVWEWMTENAGEVYGRFDETFDKPGGGLLRRISQESLSELDRIFEVTGGKDLWDAIETYTGKTDDR